MSIPTPATRTRAEIDNEYKTYSMIAGDRAFKKQVLEAKIDTEVKQIKAFDTEIQELQLKMATLFQEPALPDPLPEETIQKVANSVTQLGKATKHKKSTEKSCTA